MAGKRLTGKFSEEEYEIIKQIQEKEKINDNQMVRGGVYFLIQASLMKDLLQNTELMKMIKPFGKDIEKHVNSPKFQKKLKKMTEEIGKKKMAQIELKAKQIEDKSKILTKKKKVGRPKKKKISKKPGRPKNSDI